MGSLRGLSSWTKSASKKMQQRAAQAAKATAATAKATTTKLSRSSSDPALPRATKVVKVVGDGAADATSEEPAKPARLAGRPPVGKTPRAAPEGAAEEEAQHLRAQQLGFQQLVQEQAEEIHRLRAQLAQMQQHSTAEGAEEGGSAGAEGGAAADDTTPGGHSAGRTDRLPDEDTDANTGSSAGDHEEGAAAAAAAAAEVSGRSGGEAAAAPSGLAVAEVAGGRPTSGGGGCGLAGEHAVWAGPFAFALERRVADGAAERAEGKAAAADGVVSDNTGGSALCSRQRGRLSLHGPWLRLHLHPQSQASAATAGAAPVRVLVMDLRRLRSHARPSVHVGVAAEYAASSDSNEATAETASPRGADEGSSLDLHFDNGLTLSLAPQPADGDAQRLYAALSAWVARKPSAGSLVTAAPTAAEEPREIAIAPTADVRETPPPVVLVSLPMVLVAAALG